MMITYKLMWLSAGLTAAVLLWLLLSRILHRERELRRFLPVQIRWWHFLADDVRKFIRARIVKRGRALELEDRIATEQLIRAGFESSESRERFYLIKDISVALTATVCIVSFLSYPESIAFIVSVASIALGFFGPTWWISELQRRRQRRLERELPFLMHLIASGTVVGWDAIRVFDTLTDTLGESDPLHPLVTELRRAQWYAATGSSWANGLRQVERRFPTHVVRHGMLALASALESDGCTHELIEGIAKDAHRSYLIDLEGRLSTLPVVILVIGFMLLGGFVLVLQLPLL